MTALLQIGFLNVNEDDDPKAQPPGTMIRADNCQMDKGRVLKKRQGTTSLAKTILGGGSIAAGVRLLARGTSTMMTDGITAYSYVESLGSWQAIDRPPAWRATKRTLVDATRSVNAVDIAVSGDFVISLFTTSGITGLFYKVESLSTGARIVPDTVLLAAGFLASIGAPRVLVSGTKAYLFVSGGGGTVAVWVLDLTTFAVSSLTNLFTDGTTAPTKYDVVIGTPTAGVPTLYVAYELAAGTNRTKVASFTLSTLAPVATATVLGTTDIAIAITFGVLAQKVSIVYSTTTSGATKVASFPTNLGSTAGPDNLISLTSEYVFVAENDATNLIVGRTSNDGAGGAADRLTTVLCAVAAGHGQVATSERITFGVYAVSQPWSVASRWYASVLTWVHPYSVTSPDPIAQVSSAVVEIETTASITGAQDSTHPHVATLENYTGWPSPSSYAAHPAIVGDGRVLLAAAYRNREAASYADQPAVGWSMYTLQASTGDTFRSAPLNASSLVASAAPAWNDGDTLMPYSFACAPQILSVSAAAGGAVVAGVYSYVVTYAWRDAAGVLHRSAPSFPKKGTTATTNLSLVVKVSTSALSAKQRTLAAAQSANPIMLELWRTTIGGTGPHYRLTVEPAFGVLFNDVRAADVSFTDVKSDASIADNTTPVIALAAQAQLYTDTGELANIPPPAFITNVTHAGRLVGIGPDLRTVWPSKDSKLDPTVAPGFNEAFTIAFAKDKSALASLDDRLIVYGPDSVDIVSGDGPDETGAGGWDVRAMQTDVGCIEPRSVAVAPMGSLFRSTRGLEMIDRGLNLSWVGADIQDTLALYPNITSAVLVETEREVRFTCDNGTNGIVLAWDYGYGIWFVRKYTDAADTGIASVRFVDAALINGVYTLLTAGGQVYRETYAHKLDNGSTYVSMDILLTSISAQPGRSGWSTNNLAWQRIKDLTLMGTSVANHDLEVSFALDYSTSFSDVKHFVAGSQATAIGPLEKCRSTLKTQKCQAVQIRIRDLTPTNPGTWPVGTGDGPMIEALALRVGAKDGPAKVAAGQEA